MLECTPRLRWAREMLDGCNTRGCSRDFTAAGPPGTPGPESDCDRAGRTRAARWRTNRRPPSTRLHPGGGGRCLRRGESGPLLRSRLVDLQRSRDRRLRRSLLDTEARRWLGVARHVDRARELVEAAARTTRSSGCERWPAWSAGSTSRAIRPMPSRPPRSPVWDRRRSERAHRGPRRDCASTRTSPDPGDRDPVPGLAALPPCGLARGRRDGCVGPAAQPRDRLTMSPRYRQRGTRRAQAPTPRAG